MITCTLCGHSYDPDRHAACQTCPLHQGCSMTCCPNCGASNINPQASKLVKLITHLFGEKHVESGPIPTKR